VKLNPEKCVFGVPRGMLLGFIVSERGIEANPEKIVVITSMGPVTPGFGRQTECELCTCQDQNSRTQRLHK
jgi:hypothetical protein